MSGPYLTSGAWISEDHRYRYSLTRTWDEGGPLVNVILLNPSTADASVDDPTIRRVVNFAQQAGFHGVEITNLFALRSTDPKLLRQVDDPVGPSNDLAIEMAATKSGYAWAAWGTHGKFAHRAERVLDLLHQAKVDLWCLGITKEGYPCHPLYLSSATTVMRYA
jgi:hypothetical protein